MSSSTEKRNKLSRIDSISMASAAKPVHSCSDALHYFSKHNTMLLWSTFILLAMIAMGIALCICYNTIDSANSALYAWQVDPLRAKDIQNFEKMFLLLQIMMYTCLVTGNPF